MNYTVMIPAAGSGRRMGASTNKLFLHLLDKPILIHTLTVFEMDPMCSSIILAIKPDERQQIESYLQKYGITKVTAMVDGGNERQDSVEACIAVHNKGGIVLVHDAARPFIHQTVIHELVKEASGHGAAVAGVRAKDTMKVVVNGIIQETLDREQLWSIQTPQAFQYKHLQEASRKAKVEGFLGTDESMLVERMGLPVRIVESTYDNVKMTTQEDLLLGEVFLNKKVGEVK